MALQVLPKVLMDNTTTIPTGFASNFACDVMEHAGQKVMVCVEEMTGWVDLSLLPDHTANSLRLAMLRAVLPKVSESGASIRTDGAPAFQSLALEAKDKDSIRSKFNIKIDIGRALNKNKNPVAENKVQETEKEILRLKLSPGPISKIDLTDGG